MVFGFLGVKSIKTPFWFDPAFTLVFTLGGVPNFKNPLAVLDLGFVLVSGHLPLLFLSLVRRVGDA